MMKTRVRDAGWIDCHWLGRACYFIAKVALAVYPVLSMSRSDAQSISLAELESVWERTEIANVTVEFAVTTQSAKELTTLPKELGGGEIKLASVERFRFHRVADIGMRLDHLDSPGRNWNLMDGYGTSLEGPSKMMEGLSSAVIQFTGETAVEKHWTTNCMLYWTGPISTKDLALLTKKSDLAIPEVINSEPASP